MSLDKKKILLVIGGGISAYKALDLIRLLIKKVNGLSTDNFLLKILKPIEPK